MPNLFDYINFREYLADYYDVKKKGKSYFSYRIFSDKIGFKSRDFIYRVIHKDKKISMKSVLKIAEGLGFTEKQTDFFINLVQFNQAGTPREQVFYYEQLKRFRKSTSKTDILKKNQYEMFSKWYHGTILLLIEMKGFKGNYKWLADNVYPVITVWEAKKSVVLLEKLGLIKKMENGEFQVTNNSLATDSEVNSLALVNFYKTTSAMGINALETLAGDKRNFSGLTLGISQESYNLIIDRIIAFRKEIASIADNDKNADRVCQFNFQVFPLTNPNREGVADE